MGIVKTWVYALGAIGGIVLSWFVIIPIYYQVKSGIDNSVANGLYGIAKQTYDLLNEYASNILNYSVILFIVVIIIWAFQRSQHQERYTGRYKL